MASATLQHALASRSTNLVLVAVASLFRAYHRHREDKNELATKHRPRCRDFRFDITMLSFISSNLLIFDPVFAATEVPSDPLSNLLEFRSFEPRKGRALALLNAGAEHRTHPTNSGRAELQPSKLTNVVECAHFLANLT